MKDKRYRVEATYISYVTAKSPEDARAKFASNLVKLEDIEIQNIKTEQLPF